MPKPTASRLLILSCSRTKRPDPDLLPAIDRYDGPAFRVVRRFLSQPDGERTAIYILSAKFGLISRDQLVPNYDQKLTKSYALEIQPSVISTFQAINQQLKPQKLLICVTQLYLNALEGYQEVVCETTETQVATGMLGRKLSILHKWLYGASRYSSSKTSNIQQSKLIKVKGHIFDLRNVNILEVACEALDKKVGDPYSYQTWYIAIGEHKVSPKWLLSILTGLPVSSFHSQTARRILYQLGFQPISDLHIVVK